MARKQESKLVATLFGAIFFAAGLGFFVLFVGKTLFDRVEMRNWQPVQAYVLKAELESHQSDDSTTYRVEASYRFGFRGRSYRGYRVNVYTGSDNIGSYQQDMYQHLSYAQFHGDWVRAWVNPDNPDESVIDRNLRWGMVLFPGILTSVFMIIGAGIIYLTWRKRPAVEAAALSEKPWLAKPGWSPEGIYSNNRAALWFWWLFALVFNGFSPPILMGVSRELRRGNYLSLLALVFVAAGCFLLYKAVRKTLEHYRFGRIPVLLNPFPGEIGGRVSGWLEFPRRFGLGAQFHITLKQMTTTTTRWGEERETTTSCHWELATRGKVRNAGRGSRVYFAFAVPEGLPQSRADDGDGCWWALDVKGELSGVNFDRRYEIPVFRTRATAAAASERHAPVPETANQSLARQLAGVRVAEAQKDFTAQLEALLDIEQRDGGVLIRQAPGKQKLAWPLILFGIVFGAFGIGAGYAGAPIFFPIVFAGFGLLIGAIGVNMRVTGFETLIDRDGATHKLFRFGREKKQRYWPRASLRGLCLRCSGSTSGTDKVSVEYFDLLLQRVGGETVKISGGIAGRLAARQLLESLGMLTGLPALNEYQSRMRGRREQMEA
ncbi:DUF3592 domain-containing protein [Microbulbifer sp.]|uniref:DUF3592 domain-containing protein n=1 Tax=Microbulbifer sp. TaxID=1908541 RepID=UPI003F3B9556